MCYYIFMGTVAGQLAEDWSRFLPGALVEWAEATLSADSPPEALVGALMITDVSGFTRLTSKLSRESGQAGAERIGVVLNGYISKLVDTVERLGGAILNFEGDSLTAGWKAEADDASDLSSAVWKSCHCALSLQREIGQTTVEDEMLTLRSGVAAGTTYLVHLLSRSANRRVILTGPSMNEVSRCAALAESGETLVSPQAWSYVDKHAAGSCDGDWPCPPARYRLAAVRSTKARGFGSILSFGSIELLTSLRSFSNRNCITAVAGGAAHRNDIVHQNHRA